MNFRLIDSGWDQVLADALKADISQVRIVGPFIKQHAAQRLLKWGRPGILQVITRYNLRDFAAGVSDIQALRLLLAAGARIRGVKNLHAKLYLIGSNRTVVTSANLTDAALLRNHEFGFEALDKPIFDECSGYFDRLWKRAGTNVTTGLLDSFEKKVTEALVAGLRPNRGPQLEDMGVNAGIDADPADDGLTAEWASEAKQGFVKFFGEGDNREPRSMTVRDSVSDAGCHWACTYPKDRRPRAVSDGAVMFMGRLVEDPNDTIIFGRAIGIKYLEGRDDATPADVQLRSWKADWPHYIRVHHPEFVAGILANGVSLNSMMSELGPNSFATTQRNLQGGTGNINPRKAYMRQPAVEVTSEGMAWLNSRLERSFAANGKLPNVVLDELDWPAVRVLAAKSGR